MEIIFNFLRIFVKFEDYKEWQWFKSGEMSKSVAILAATATLVLGVAVYYLILARKKKVQIDDIWNLFLRDLPKKKYNQDSAQPSTLMQLKIFPKSTNKKMCSIRSNMLFDL